MQDTEELLGIALGLKSPWKIKSVDFNELQNYTIMIEKNSK